MSTQPVQGLEQIAREAAKQMCDDNFTEGDEKHVLPYILRACQAAVEQARL